MLTHEIPPKPDWLKSVNEKERNRMGLPKLKKYVENKNYPSSQGYYLTNLGVLEWDELWFHPDSIGMCGHTPLYEVLWVKEPVKWFVSMDELMIYYENLEE